jgi:hypothetical protein
MTPWSGFGVGFVAGVLCTLLVLFLAAITAKDYEP